MKHYRFEGLIQNHEWLAPAYISVNEKGEITYLSNKKEDEDREYEKVNGYALPGFQNAHSHAFQYAMAGLAEKHTHGSNPDDFWSWREAMYQLALSIDPDQLEAIAAMLYAEMLRHGYTSVAEFHYLHHQKDGNTYNNLSELGERLISAAQTTGIKITLVPMFYQKGGFGMDPSTRQRRFISKDLDAYMNLLESSQKSTAIYSNANCGMGIHSLRAVEPETVVRTIQELPDSIPFHIHISEQLKEINDAISFLKKRPVEWLSENVQMNDHFHLVHATHVSSNEIKVIAESGAHVVLCPSTEGNLGDGIFPLREFQALGGNWSIGTDSHIGLNPLEELRILDYGQRLTSHKRNTFVSSTCKDSGLFALEKSILGGRKAMGNLNNSYFAIGESFDALIIDKAHPLLSCSKIDNLISTLIYAGDPTFMLGTMVNGQWLVKNQHHNNIESIKNRFMSVMADLGIR
ncbi:formimidoylglutamate deiminase [Fulvivirgaceae bacterium BMA10]|uniref:Formimidoylglutamate deiminase n=1 Tax=Splendidivirga corallicola TaxID=3051826 RepID=A0ABT8KIR8_9BACT|nr:formimidoylglutamate deiminase [Fulvivirgaceae bacterium BMA10]